jgi:hypothetical protein
MNETIRTRETREGWPLLTVESEANGDSKSTSERDPSSVDSLGSSCRYKRFLFCLAALIGPVQNIFFLTIHYFNFFVPISQHVSSLGRYVFGSEISYNKAPPRLPGLGC